MMMMMIMLMMTTIVTIIIAIIFNIFIIKTDSLPKQYLTFTETSKTIQRPKYISRPQNLS